MSSNKEYLRLRFHHDDVIKWNFRVTGPLCGEFTGHRWISLTKASDAGYEFYFFYLCRNKRLRKQSRGWWFETPSRSLWRHRNVLNRNVRYRGEDNRLIARTTNPGTSTSGSKKCRSQNLTFVSMNRPFSLWAGLTVHEPGHVFHEPNKCSVRIISVSCRQRKWCVQYRHDETNPEHLTNKIVELCRTEFKLGNRGGSYIFIHIWTMSWRMMEKIPLECTVNITIFITDVLATSGTMESAAIVLS